MANNQQSFELEPKKSGPVECLGMTFESDEARRAYFLERLKEKLQDPEFHKMPGFPAGTDEDILRMSDPPYYTACPNPFLQEFVQVYGRPYDPNEEYHREPFAVDVSEGKSDDLYKVHAYYTKVPPAAIIPSISHYTTAGDVILDGFSGSGMTGVAVELLNAKGSPDQPRFIILNDLSPHAALTSYNYATPFPVQAFIRHVDVILNDCEQQLGWMWRTVSSTGGKPAALDGMIWSEVYRCPSCHAELIFYDIAQAEAGKVKEVFECSYCKTQLKKSQLDVAQSTSWDDLLASTRTHQKLVPVAKVYNSGKRKVTERITSGDLDVLEQVQNHPLPHDTPVYLYPFADMWEAPRLRSKGITHVHQLFTRRMLLTLTFIWRKIGEVSDARIRNALTFWFDSQLVNLSLQNRYRPGVSFPYNPLTGVYYLGSLILESSPFTAYRNKADRIAKSFNNYSPSSGTCLASTGSAGSLLLQDNSIDYIFTDPPFGDNLPYSELNAQIEGWYGVLSHREPEAVVERSLQNKARQKGISEYQNLMRACFNEYYRVLKPGRWMTVVFSNSSNSVWRAIQEALANVGFVVADVRTLDKQQRSFKQVTSIAVQQDLVISAYKPSGRTQQSLSLSAFGEESAWSFVEEHLANVPLFVAQSDESEVILERTPQKLFDRMIAFHVQRGMPVPLDAGDFFRGLDQRYPIRDGMYFLSEQALEYDKKRAKVQTVKQLSFDVTDEASAILWLRVELDRKPQSFQDLTPAFMRESQTWAGHEKTVELKEILEENFLLYDGGGPVPPQIHTYLSTNFKDMRGLSKDDPVLKAKAAGRWYVPDPNKQADLDQLRIKRLLKEFAEYKESKQKKLKQFRTEAIRAGFKAAYDQKDYRTIVDVASKLPEKVVQEDEKLLMYYDVASMRLGED